MCRLMDLRPEGIPGLPMPRYFSNGLSVCGGSALVVMRGFFFSGRLTIPYFGMEAVLLKDCQRGAMQGRRAADHVERGNPGWYGGTGRGRVLVLGWAALRACQDAGKAAYEAQCNEGRARAQYCKSTRANLRLVLSRAGKSKSRDSPQRPQSKSASTENGCLLSADCGVAMIVRRSRCAGNCRRDAGAQRQPLRLWRDAFGFCTFVGLTGFQVPEFFGPAAGPVDDGAVDLLVVGYAESNG